MKRLIVAAAIAILLGLIAASAIDRRWLWALFLIGPLLLVLIHDLLQRRHTILRNYPIFGHFRYFFEDFRQHVRQYFIQGDDEGVPFVRTQRAIVYARAKGEINSHPFGTIRDIYAEGYEWMNHSLSPRDLPPVEPRITMGGEQCARPYLASRFNISAMSFGSLGDHAIEALNWGAKVGNFFHNTGEGGVSMHHLKHGGDLVWEIGTAYFGCRTAAGHFDPDRFADSSRIGAVKMVEIKLSQGAKPGGGGTLPGKKVSREIAEARGVPVGKDVLSPPSFDEFDSPLGLLAFVQRLRELSGGKPVGFKLCIGHPREFFGIVKAMLESGIRPDFITVDGSEGGTGAASLELSDSIGTPLREGLIFTHNALVGAGLRDHIRVIASGKIINGFDIAAKLAMGADMCNSARGFMFALGCIQARVCNKNICPTGVTTLDTWRQHGLVVSEKYQRVARYHRETIAYFLQVLGACGLEDPSQLHAGMLNRRMSPTAVRNYHELYSYLEPGVLLDAPETTAWASAWATARPDSFGA